MLKLPRSAPWPLWLATIGLVGVLLLLPYLWSKPGTGTERAALPPPVGRQADVLAERLVTAEELLGLSKLPDPGSYTVFEVETLEKPDTASEWLFLKSPKSNEPDTILSRGAHRIELIKMTRMAGRDVTFEGHWAEFVTDYGYQVRDGTLQGPGLFDSAEAPIIARLEYTCRQNASRERLTLSARPQTSGATDTRFLYEIERADDLLPLLYVELLNQGRYAWAREYEAFLPAVVDSRTAVPYVNDSDAKVTVDGVLSEPVWPRSHAGRTTNPGSLPGHPGLRPPLMYVRYGSQALYLAFRALGRFPAATGLELTLSRRFDIPVDPPEIWSVSYRNPEWMDRVYARRGQTQNWDCQWQVDVSQTDQELQAEVLIPFDNLGLEIGPEPGESWRLNAALMDYTNPRDPKTVARWGFPIGKETQHGIVLVFQSARGSSP